MEKPKASINKLCGLFGKTKQAFYKKRKTDVNHYMQDVVIVETVKKIRYQTKTSRWGVRKLLPLIKMELTGSQINIGR